MDLLIDDLYLPIMAAVDTFKDRWALSQTCRKWHGVYKELLRPYNDGLASTYMRRTWNCRTQKGPVALQNGLAWYYELIYDGRSCVRRFGLNSPTCLVVHWDDGSDMFKIELDGMQWVLTVYRFLRFARIYNTIMPSVDYVKCGFALHVNKEEDVFDQVSRMWPTFIQSVCEIHEHCPPEWATWTEDHWKAYVHFDPALARRIYHFPYFVRLRQETK